MPASTLQIESDEDRVVDLRIRERLPRAFVPADPSKHVRVVGELLDDVQTEAVLDPTGESGRDDVGDRIEVDAKSRDRLVVDAHVRMVRVSERAHDAGMTAH